MIHPRTRELLIPARERKIIFLVLDGLGGLPDPDTGRTELDVANLPHLDRLAASSSGGRVQPVAPGVTPGSGPAHLALFGYHPFEVEFGRGALEALGSDFNLEPGDLAARANFASIDPEGNVRDRRAGRPPDAENVRLTTKLREGLKGRIEGVEIFLLPGKEHRFTVVFRGEGLVPGLNDNDPQREGLPLLEIRAEKPQAEKSARIAHRFLEASREILKDEAVATGILLRGFSGLPEIMPFSERYGVDPGAIAAYPMYRGVARLVGMKVLGTPENFEGELDLLESSYGEHDFFFVHFKGTDSAGHSGDFAQKVEQLQFVDSLIPRIEALEPEVLVITGDHSTPCIHEEHSWHPVPTLIRSPLALPFPGSTFTERSLMTGDLGIAPSTDLMPLALAHASRLKKFGA